MVDVPLLGVLVEVLAQGRNSISTWSSGLTALVKEKCLICPLGGATIKDDLYAAPYYRATCKFHPLGALLTVYLGDRVGWPLVKEK
jgi:hypothetical protein